MGIFVTTPTYVIFADHILFSVSHTTSSNNTSSHTLCVSSTESVIKKFSTAWYTIYLHSTIECGLFYRMLKQFLHNVYFAKLLPMNRIWSTQ